MSRPARRAYSIFAGGSLLSGSTSYASGRVGDKMHAFDRDLHGTVLVGGDFAMAPDASPRTGRNHGLIVFLVCFSLRFGPAGSSLGGRLIRLAREGVAVRLYDHARDLVRSLYDARLDTPAVLDTDRFFPEAPTALSPRWRDIRDEALAIRRNLARCRASTTSCASRRQFPLMTGATGACSSSAPMASTCRRTARALPVISSLLAQAPEVESSRVVFPRARKHMPRHRGPFRGIFGFISA